MKPTKPRSAKPKAAKPAPTPPPPPPAPETPELDIEPWTVSTIQSQPKSVKGRMVVTITARLMYRGRTMVSNQGANATAELQALAHSYNARRVVPVIHKKAYADMSETARAHTATRDCNINNIMKPFVG